MELIQACNGELEIFGPYTSTLADCFVRTKMINEVTFKHNPREANRVAHLLAKHSYDTQSAFDWDGDPPNFILSYVINDVTLLTVK